VITQTRRFICKSYPAVVERRSSCNLETAECAQGFLLQCWDTSSVYCFFRTSLKLYASGAFVQSPARVSASQRPRRDETRLPARSARTRETRRADSLDDEHQTSLQKRTFFYSIFSVLRVQTRPSTASLERHRSPEARRRDARLVVVTQILITRATRPSESMRERTMRSVRLRFT